MIRPSLAVVAFAASTAFTPFAALLDAHGSAPHASVGRATYEGAWTDKIATFKGVPFAKPPVGALRWKPPESNDPSGAIKATNYSAQCMQSDRLHAWTKGIAKVFGTEDKVGPVTLAKSEDCLYLNVWSPKLKGAAPVMVWIHGGSNISGSGNEALYDGSELAKRGVVVVSINYRLGMLGFMVHPALVAESPKHAAGNYAMLDQIEALRWVRQNIAAFGGDPKRVTLFGESAGSIDIVHLMASPLTKGLFDRAIGESGSPMARMPNVQLASAFGTMFAKSLGVDTTGDVLAQLRAKPAAELLAIQDDFAPLVLAAGPVVDGWVFTDMTARVWERGEQANVPMIIGSNAFEMTTLKAYVPAFPRTVTGYQQWVGRTLGAQTDKVLAIYPVTEDGAVEDATLHLMTDLFMTCPVRIAARAMQKAGRPTYRYYFTRVMPGGEKLGAYHASEIGYVFGVKLPWLPTSPADDRLSATMMGYWTRFAATGNPNGAGAPAWPAYDGASDPYLELGDVVAAHSDLKKDACDAMDTPLKAQFAGGK
ncbi:MAG: carboxylesterase family protein [Gemmatimonadaceae bacterium]